jgi:acetoacetyl-CoA reductase
MKNMIALVTGGTGGIGTAICQKLSKEGIKVAATYHHEEKAKQWLKQQQELGYSFFIVPSKVEDFDSCGKTIAAVEEALGPIDVLVNNAGITRDTQLKNMTYEQWQEVVHTNLDSVFNMSRQVISGMITRNYGRIINISSINGQKGQFGQANYSAAKAGIHGFTKALAQEVARKGITVNTVSPGYTATEMVMAVPEDIRQKIIAQIPVGRLGEPQEIAHAVAFLASPDSGFITGSDLSINGGQHMY